MNALQARTQGHVYLCSILEISRDLRASWNIHVQKPMFNESMDANMHVKKFADSTVYRLTAKA
jgi:hypothetical protein